MQAFFAFIMQPGSWREVAYALIGVKPIVETWRVLIGQPKPPRQFFSAEGLLAMSRLTEVLLESLPQAVLQAYVFLQTPSPSLLQRISLLGSLAAAGYILASADYDMDTSQNYRRIEPTQYGMFPTRGSGDHHAVRRAVAMFFGDALRLAAHLASRAVAVAVALTVASATARWLVPVWLAVEFVIFNLTRWLEAGTWRNFRRGANSRAISLLMNLIHHLVVIAAPLLWFRMPFFVCPHIWAGGIVATALSNTALLGVAFHLAEGAGVTAETGGGGGGGLASSGPAFEMLAACVGAEVIGSLLVWISMVPRYRPSLWRRRTARQHVELTLWEECTFHKWGPTRNDARAKVLAGYANCYWPNKALVTAWVNENWAAWQAAPPHWFTAKWKALFPPDWLPQSEEGSRSGVIERVYSF